MGGQKQRKFSDQSSEAAPALAESLHDRFSRLSRQLRSIDLPDGMTQERMSVLAIVESRGPISVTALADHERVRPATMSRMISALEADGFVKRIRDVNDGRGVLVASTRRGRHAFEIAQQQRLARFSVALNSLPDDELQSMGQLATVLEHLTNVLDEPSE